MQEKGYAAVNGTRLYYEVTGEGEALVLLHSGYADSSLWNEQFEVFGQYFKVVRYDIRGFGRSDRPRQSFSHSADLKALLDYLKIDKAHLVGVSMGGSIAIDFALQYPDSVVCLVLSGPSLNGYMPAIDEASEKRSLAGISIVKKDENFEASVGFMLDDPMWRQSKPQARQRLKDMFINTSLDWLLDDTIHITDSPATERLSEIDKRTLLIIGSEDSKPIFEIAGVLEANIAMLQKITIEGTGHLPNLDKPEAFNKIVLDFI